MNYFTNDATRLTSRPWPVPAPLIDEAAWLRALEADPPPTSRFASDTNRRRVKDLQWLLAGHAPNTRGRRDTWLVEAALVVVVIIDHLATLLRRGVAGAGRFFVGRPSCRSRRTNAPISQPGRNPFAFPLCLAVDPNLRDWLCGELLVDGACPIHGTRS